MFEKESNKSKPTQQEAKENLVAFFDLILKIDRRINPELYQNPLIQEEESHD
jgi:hypothetical protein